MISLSNQKHYKYIKKEKVIELKPVQINKTKIQVQDEQSAESYLRELEGKIELKTNELRNLEQTYAQKQIELHQKIEEQRNAWQEERDQYIAEAKETGYKDGFMHGKEESLNQYRQKIDEINRLAKLAYKDYESTVQSSTETILKLAIHTAEKILNEKIKDDASSFNSIVEAVLKTVKTDDLITIYVHPSKYELLIQQKDQLQKNVDGQARVQIFINNELHEEGCIIEHPFGQIDASVDTQLKQIHKILQNINNGE